MKRLIFSAMVALGAATMAPSVAAAQAPAQGDVAKAKDDFVRSSGVRLSQIDRRLAEIGKRTDMDSKTVVNEVKPKRDNAQKMLQDIQAVNGDGWMSMRADLDRLLTESEQALSRIPMAPAPAPQK